MRVKGGPFKFNSAEFSKRIKKLRLKHDLKQHNIADGIKKTRAAYGGCENGHFTPGTEMLIGLREVYKKYGESISMDYLFGFTDSIEGIVGRVDQSMEINRLQEIIKEKDDMIATQKDLIKMLKESKR